MNTQATLSQHIIERIKFIFKTDHRICKLYSYIYRISILRVSLNLIYVVLVILKTLIMLLQETERISLRCEFDNHCYCVTLQSTTITITMTACLIAMQHMK